jgi:hypothetical protein
MNEIIIWEIMRIKSLARGNITVLEQEGGGSLSSEEALLSNKRVIIVVKGDCGGLQESTVCAVKGGVETQKKLVCIVKGDSGGAREQWSYLSSLNAAEHKRDWPLLLPKGVVRERTSGSSLSSREMLVYESEKVVVEGGGVGAREGCDGVC